MTTPETTPPDVSSALGAYPVGPLSRVRRLHERASYDLAAVWAVLDAAVLCHVAWTLDGRPLCTPTIHWRDGDRLYWHGSAASRMLRTQAEGLPVCVTVSHLDGFVLARSAFHHSVNYRSVMCFGTARLIDDPAEKVSALDALVNRLYPDRAAALRPILDKELKATSVVGMTIDEASAKVRAAGVSDDEADLSHPVWAGVIPVRTVIGAVEPQAEGVAAPMSEGLALYRPGRPLDETLLETQRRWEAAGPAEG